MKKILDFNVSIFISAFVIVVIVVVVAVVVVYFYFSINHLCCFSLGR